jgi:hypothetical protein
MARSTKMQANSKMIWKQGDGWIQFNPPPKHPCYEEWQKLKQQKEKENDSERD